MTTPDKNNQQMPKFPEPYWRSSVQLPSFPVLQEDIAADVAIVGGGISGITTAYLLVKEGVKVVLIDAGEILNGTTGHTTAKITAQHGLIYNELINHFGVEKAKLYYEANNDALQWIKQTINNHQIDCDFQEDDAYIYTNDTNYFQQLNDEMKAYEKLGIDSEFVTSIPIDVQMKAAIKMKNQAQFHPLKYLQVLVDYIVDHGGQIFEHTTAIDVDENEKMHVITRNGKKIKCDYVLACSHFPFYDGLGFYPTRLYAERSYIIAAKTEKKFPGGMYINAEKPTRSLRNAMINDEQVVLFAGENHKTGQGISTIRHYEALEQFAKQTLGMKAFLYRWSAQDLTTLDKIPYIGEITTGEPRILIATGYRKWGMSNGTAAARLLSDMILKRENRYVDLYTPKRFSTDPSVKTFLKENIDVAKHLIEGKLEYPLRTTDELSNDEGAVVQVNGKRAGAYKDEHGKLYIVDTTCTHLGCEVEWNSGDRTWDCPCHGSRYSIVGDIIDGPAEKPLQRIEEK